MLAVSAWWFLPHTHTHPVLKRITIWFADRLGVPRDKIQFPERLKDLAREKVESKGVEGRDVVDGDDTLYEKETADTLDHEKANAGRIIGEGEEAPEKPGEEEGEEEDMQERDMEEQMDWMTVTADLAMGHAKVE